MSSKEIALMAHLMRRAGFGATRDEMEEYVTNGYEATVIFQGYDTSFITDYMKMDPGKNVIEVEWRVSTDSKVRTYRAETYER